MMKRTIVLLLALFANMFLFADEGMWQPYMLNNQNLAEMQKLGCKLTKEQIFDLNKPSIKDAIVQFGGGCTGELISSEGLLLTNHHCGIGYVQKHSSVEADYLTDGFWAYSKQEELSNPGLTVYFLNYVKDVTEQMLVGVTEQMTETERYNKIVDNKHLWIAKQAGDRDVKVEIVPFYAGNQYIMFEYLVYADVRLAACPPWGIGKYGADTDNWTWPRHKGDFCIFRVYTAPDGSPAEYAEENIPMKSKHYLPISMKGVKEGDYAMIIGYPGSTDRYSSSQNVKLIINHEGPAIVKCRTAKLEVYRKYMDADKETFIKYASKQSSVSNYWKYYIGQVKQLKRNRVVQKRMQQEREFADWIAKDFHRNQKYEEVLPLFKAEYQIRSKYQKALTYYIEAGLYGSEAVKQALAFRTINDLLQEGKKEEAKERAIMLQERTDAYFKDYAFELDKEATTVLLNLFYKDIPKDLRPEMINKIGELDKGDFTYHINKSFNKSIFTNQERMNKWLKKPYSLKRDPVYQLMQTLLEGYRNVVLKISDANDLGEKAARLYMEGLMEMYKDKVNFYPDATFTMRLTYGTVESYKPADAVKFDYKTDLDGVIDKYIPGNWEFDLPAKLVELHKMKDYGEYADENGDLIVNFITTNDITGGNSGSAVLDGEGNLIGLAFDGNWEAMSGDISFEQKVQRTICMDARYLLFVIDKVANAQNIMEELTIIK